MTATPRARARSPAKTSPDRLEMTWSVGSPSLCATESRMRWFACSHAGKCVFINAALLPVFILFTQDARECCLAFNAGRHEGSLGSASALFKSHFGLMDHSAWV